MTIKQQQCLLFYLGYDTGPIDGVDGPRTQAALAAFTADYGVGADGLPGAVSGMVAKKRKPPDTNIPNESNQVSNESNGKTGTSWGDLKYISREEFRCTCRGRYCNGFPVEPSLATAKIDEAIREHFGKPLTITSGIRCARRNAEVGGVSNSQHVQGTASDIQVAGVSPAQVAAYAETLMPDSGGIGIYSWGVHIDTRADKSRWRG